jgi:uncharacterized protein (TIGR00106 family)
MVLLEFSIFPTDKGESVSQYVAPIIQIIDESKIAYQLTPMGTVLEGSYKEVMSVVEKCFDALEKVSSRVSMSLKIDYRKGDKSRLQSKIAKVEELIGRKVCK